MILGGYGNFGARIARALAGNATIELVIGGRDASRAAALAAQLGPRASSLGVNAQRVDLAHTLRSHGIGLVVHTAGPFQQQRYGVALAAANAGAHYIDLADGRRFVCDFASHTNEAFRAAGRCAISGASTVPALSSAVVDHLARGWQRIDSIQTCIAPAQTAPRGVATMAAVLSYCGEPIDVWRNGRWQTLRGWAQPTPVQFARMRPRLGAVCDTPDLELFPSRYAGVSTVLFHAALEVTLSQRALGWLAALRAAGLMPRLARWARAFNGVAAMFDGFGSPRGGMFVRVRGLAVNGEPVARSWHIMADHNHGPEIPCMAAVVLARRLAAGESWQPGARPCTGLLALSDFEPEFARWAMHTDLAHEAA